MLKLSFWFEHLMQLINKSSYCCTVYVLQLRICACLHNDSVFNSTVHWFVLGLMCLFFVSFSFFYPLLILQWVCVNHWYSVDITYIFISLPYFCPKAANGTYRNMCSHIAWCLWLAGRDTSQCTFVPPSFATAGQTDAQTVNWIKRLWPTFTHTSHHTSNCLPVGIPYRMCVCMCEWMNATFVTRCYLLISFCVFPWRA